MMRSDEGFATKRSWVFLVAFAVIAVLFFPSSDLFADGPCGGNPSCQTAPTTGGWKMPVDVANSGSPTQREWYKLGWDTFVAMNWPYKIGGIGGEPDKTRCICLPGNCPTPDQCLPTAWMTYMSKDQVFLEGGISPGFWTTPHVRIPGFNGTNACVPFAGNASCLPVFGELSKTTSGNPLDLFDEARTDRPLLDTNLKYVVFETRLNQSEFMYLRITGYYNRQCQLEAFPTTPPYHSTFAGLPKTGAPPLADWAQQGAVEVKAAWRQLDDVPANLHYRYYTQRAYYIIPGGTEPLYVGPVTLGLVGFHILRLTPTTGSTWYWATFSQVDNVEITNMAEPTPPEPSFNRNISPPSPYYECCDPMPDCPDTASGCPPCKVVGGEDLPPPTCVNVSRNPNITGAPHQSDLDAVNADYQNRVQGTPWEYYRLLNTLNPATDNSCPTSDPNCVVPPLPNGAQMNRAWMTNPVLETYGQVSTPNCNSCHGRAFPVGAGPNTQYFNSDFQIFTFLLPNEAQGTVCPSQEPSCGGTAHTVSVRDSLQFVPQNITVAPGDTITWVLDNTIDSHTITSQLGGVNCANCPSGGGGSCGTLFDSGDKSGNQTFTYQIPANQTANIPYVCRPHCSLGMTGLITVEACPEAIPTVSEWSLIILTVLAFTAGTILFRHRRRAAT